jgi:hypothetical protein
MKNANILRQTILISMIVFLSSSVACMAQNSVADKPANDVKTIKKGRYTLVFECKDPSFNQATSQKLIDTYFKVYPKLVKKYNKKVTKSVKFVIDPGYNGVAATSNGRIVFSSKYMTSHPTDIDIVTHETMHIVQSYGGRSGMPGWLTEGIADYVRYASGVDNAGGGWSLPKFSEKQSYKNSYRITARFLAWLEYSGHKGIVSKLDQAGRDKTYDNGAIWSKLTGKTIDELWADYAKNPALPNVN